MAAAVHVVMVAGSAEHSPADIGAYFELGRNLHTELLTDDGVAHDDLVIPHLVREKDATVAAIEQ